ncbi:putative F-box protein atfbl3 [Tripterygium wilfordii]|uniref:Putative F-box protein atfbl3 n=1 Tax=Tripterygium wilfordii TaxID=458696 RepID=A0A7J7CTI7_TRIWF|nr:putative F-box protein atfbl3 [Tripterygium wilfordii]
MKRQRSIEIINLFDLLSEESMFTILDLLHQNPLDKKSFSLVCKSFYNIESKHRRVLKPLRQEHLLRILNRYPNVNHIDLTLCPRVNDSSLEIVAKKCRKELRSIDLSRSPFFSGGGLLSLAENCKNLVEIDLSNSTELRDSAMGSIAEAKNLEKLWLGRCKQITDMGVGCIAVRCKKLRLLCLKWCMGVGDLGVELIAVKCKEIRYLDLSYLPITNECLSSVLKLQYLEDLILEGCFCIDDYNHADIEHRCKSLKSFDMSNCHNISHVGLSSLIGAAESLQQLTLGYGSPVTVSLVGSLQKLSVLQSIRLDGGVVTCDV